MAEYFPTPEQEAVIGEIDGKFQRWRRLREPHERQWFVTSAMIRGNQDLDWNNIDNRLSLPPAPKHRVRLKINRMAAKLKARRAKILKNRPIPIVIPASPEWED